MLAMVVLLVAGCSKTVEGEQKAWKANLSKSHVCHSMKIRTVMYDVGRPSESANLSVRSPNADNT